MPWTEVREVDGVLRADRTDGAFIERSGLYGSRPWRAHGPNKHDWLCVRLYADLEQENGPVRTFKYAKSAAAAVDAKWPLAEERPNA